jgi:hypothetical protein
VITSLLAEALGTDFNYQMSASAVFREMAERVPAYEGLRYPLLKDETNPVQAKYKLAGQRDAASLMENLRQSVEKLSDTGEKLTETPPVGHELFKTATLTSKVPQFHLLAAGNPEPPDVLVSPLYQITLDSNLRRETVATAGD